MNLWANLREWWGKRRERVVGASGVGLDDRLKAADYFLAYAARKKIDLKLDDIVPKLARAAAAEKEKRPLSETEATDFWVAYTALAKAVAPVTADSILASGAFFKTSAGELMRGSPGKAFRAWALGALAVLVLVQMYWLIGSNLVGEIDRIENEINAALVTLVATNGDGGKAVQALYPAKTSTALFQFCIGDSKKFDADNIIVRGQFIDFILNKINDTTVSLASTRNATQAGKLDAIKDPPADGVDSNVSEASAARFAPPVTEKIESAIDLERICIFAHKERLNLVYDQLQTWTTIDLLLRLFPSSSSVQSSSSPAVYSGFRSGDESQHVSNLRTSRLSLEILSKYILPLLYGFLGACTFVIRQLSAEVKDEVYSRASDTAFWLRMLLGLIAGLSAAWFLNPLVLGSEQKTMAALSPLALAFVAGYSVELLFTAMDRLIGAFTNKPSADALQKSS